VRDLARHWLVVAETDAAMVTTAASWVRRAGDEAAAAADIDEAIARYEQACVLWSMSDAEHGETLLRLGSALSACGRSAEADDRFRQALHLAEATGDERLYARAAVGLAGVVRYGIHDPERISMLERAVAKLPAEDHVLRTMSAAMLKRQLGFDDGDDAYERRQQAARLVLDAVSQPDLSDELLLTLGTARDAIMVDDPDVLVRLSRRTIQAGTAARQLHVQAHGWYGQAWAALELADADGWCEATEAFAAVAAELSLPFELALASTMQATTALIEGRYADAQAAAARSFRLGVDADPNALAIHLTNTVMTEIDLGHASSMVAIMGANRDALAEVPTFMAGFAITAALGGQVELARELLSWQASKGFGRVRRDLEWLPVIGFLSHTAAVLGELDHAGELYGLLASHPARAVRVGPLAGWWGPTDHHLGALSRVLGDLERAEWHLREAIRTCRRMEARPWLARCQLELARTLDARAVPREPQRLRSAAAELSGELGAPGLVDR
jgi:tetratricopeptide (TPR) repeat protein